MSFLGKFPEDFFSKKMTEVNKKSSNYSETQTSNIPRSALHSASSIFNLFNSNYLEFLHIFHVLNIILLIQGLSVKFAISKNSFQCFMDSPSFLHKKKANSRWKINIHSFIAKSFAILFLLFAQKLGTQFQSNFLLSLKDCNTKKKIF